MINQVVSVAVDSAGNVYVANGNAGGATPSILEFSAGSTGNIAPMRTISGSATMLSVPRNLSVDGAGNIYVLNDLNILKFSPRAMGNAAPTSTMSSTFFENSNIAVQ